MSEFLFLIFAVALYLGIWNAGVRRRNAQSWDTRLSRLRSNWRFCPAGEFSLWQEGLSATPEDTWRRIEGAKGLCAMYQNAGIMLEMADYAARDGTSVDRNLLETLANNAMHIRINVLIALGQSAFSLANDGICLHAFHATTIYVEMAARMVQLLQAKAAGIVPDFVAAM